MPVRPSRRGDRLVDDGINEQERDHKAQNDEQHDIHPLPLFLDFVFARYIVTVRHAVVCALLVNGSDRGRRLSPSSFGSLAMLLAIRRASSSVSTPAI